jgi:hypothetical protein
VAKSGISFSLNGSTSKTQKFLQRMQKPDLFSGLDGLAQRGVSALEAATPKDSALTAASWSYEIETKGGKTTITWLNTNTVDGVNIAIILQYGHGTGTGGYVSGRDYINPALKPIFDEIASDVWKKVTLA